MIGFSYDRLCKKSLDEKTSKLDLQKIINTTPHAIVTMGLDENVSMEIFGRIYRYFKCDISKVLEFKVD